MFQILYHCITQHITRRVTHGELLLLGQRYRRELYGSMGEQDHVLHRQHLRARYLESSRNFHKCLFSLLWASFYNLILPDLT